MEKQQKIKVRQLESLKGYLIFVALSVASMAWLIFRTSGLAVLVAVFIWVRLYRSQQFLLIVSCFLASLLFSCYGYWHIAAASQGAMAPAETIEAKLVVDPNSLVIDGDVLTFEGQNQETKEIYGLHYQLQSEAEKKSFFNQTTFLELTGELKLEVPVGQRNLEGFDYRQFLLEKGIYRIGELEGIRKYSEYPSKTVIDMIKVWRKRLAVHMATNFSPVTASYMKSLFLGMKDATFKNQREVWRELGILHFFSISGMHVFFFIHHFRQGLLRLRLTLETVFWLELIFLFGYLFLAGFSTSVGRSVLVVGLRAINRQFNWQFSELDCWSATLVLSLIINPYVLFQAAGQLSFALSFYMIYLRPIVAKVMPLFRQLLFSVIVSVLAIPIMSAHFYEWHLFGIVLSFLLMPVFINGLLPILSLLLGVSCFGQVESLSQLVEVALRAFQQVLGTLSTVSSLKVVTGSLPPWLYLICVLVSLIWLAQSDQIKIRRWRILVLIGCLPSLATYTDAAGIIAFVDVGQGDSIFIQRPFRQEAMLIDTGGRLLFGEREAWQQKDFNPSQASYTLIPFLKSRGIKTLNQVFISHGDDDHFGDLTEVSKTIEIRELLYPEGSLQQANFYETLLKVSNQTNQKLTMAGDVWQNQDYHLEVLYPKVAGDGGNDDSMVLLLSVKGKKILLTGDLETFGETELRADFPELSADILKVGHHGSRTSSTEPFLKQIEAETAIISCGSNNRFGHPHDETLGRLREANMEIYQTDQQGMIYYQWFPWGSELSDVQTIRKSD